jgi:hypothetical protein
MKKPRTRRGQLYPRKLDTAGRRRPQRSYRGLPASSTAGRSRVWVAMRSSTRGSTPGPIQGWLGHRSITSAAVYTALAPNRFRDFWRD